MKKIVCRNSNNVDVAMKQVSLFDNKENLKINHCENAHQTCSQSDMGGADLVCDR